MVSHRPEQNQLAGILLRLCAATCFAGMAALIKLAHVHGMPTIEIGFYRFAFGLPPLILWIALSRNWTAWRTRRPGAHAWRAAIGLTTMMMGFSALGFLPLAEATTIGFAAPLFAVILSAAVLKERVGVHRWSAVFIGLVGVLVVMRPDGSQLPVVGLALATGGAFGSSGSPVLRSSCSASSCLSTAPRTMRPRGGSCSRSEPSAASASFC
jgi:drug/metabolite transporter (DMT)-like permease